MEKKEKQKDVCTMRRVGARDWRIPKAIWCSWSMLPLRAISGSMVQEQQEISYHEKPDRHHWSELLPGIILMSKSFDSSPHPSPGHLERDGPKGMKAVLTLPLTFCSTWDSKSYISQGA